MKKAVLLNGPRNSGKTLATKLLLNTFDKGEKITCKDKLHELTMTLFGVSPTRYWDIYNDQDMKEIPLPEFMVRIKSSELTQLEKLLGDFEFPRLTGYNTISNTYLIDLSCREAMIYVSEVVVKPRFGSDFFGQARARSILQSDNSLFIDDSAAFLEECPPLIEALGQDNILLIRTHREGSTFEGDSRNYIKDGVFNNTIDLYNIGSEKEWLNKIQDVVGGFYEQTKKSII